uniref:Uncharacterized protein n=1 Tax=Rhizophora mucronata TaxID=61149 RepID=A0A2P2QK87_RHIMU
MFFCCFKQTTFPVELLMVL